jgi:hypothetical protein
MLKTTIFGFAVLGMFLSLSVVSYADSPVACAQGVDQANYWQIRAWSAMSHLFSDRGASWISMTAPATVRNMPACGALKEGQKQIVTKLFTNTAAGYVGVQALGDDHLTVRIRDEFQYPLYEFTAVPGDFTGAMISEVIRLTTGPFTLELESTDEGGGASAVIATIVGTDGKTLVHTDATWTGQLAGPSN